MPPVLGADLLGALELQGGAQAVTGVHPEQAAPDTVRPGPPVRHGGLFLGGLVGRGPGGIS